MNARDASCDCSSRRSERTAKIKARACALGFDLVGIAPARPIPEMALLAQWLRCGYAGEMGYIARRFEERSDPRKVLEGARSAIVVGFVYDAPAAARPEPQRGEGTVARYAGGRDYHDVLKRPLSEFAESLEALDEEPVRVRAYMDTGPVQERLYAAYAGLGWIGKNSCVLNREFGSYFFLGVVLTDLELDYDAVEAAHCGTCTACIDACPTAAIVEPGVVDSRLCISYTTIEQHGVIPENLREAHGAHVFGCDICQEVCPWNQRKGRSIPGDPLGLRAQLAPAPGWTNPSLAWMLSFDEAAFRKATAKTAMRRSKFRGLIRNALVAAGVSGDGSLLPRIRPFLQNEDPLLVEHARWAVEWLEAKSASD